MKKVICWAAAIAWMVFIFMMSSVPGEISAQQSGAVTGRLHALLAALFSGAPLINIELLEVLIRKTAHMAEYGILFLLLRAALSESRVKHPGITALLLCTAYGASDEIHQAFSVERGPSVRDVVIDTLGALAAAGFRQLYYRIRFHRQSADTNKNCSAFDR